MDKNNFRIVVTPGRMQPYATWRGATVVHFDATQEAAEAWLTERLRRTSTASGR